MKSDARRLVSASLFAFAQFALGGVVLAAGALGVSLFQSGARAEYTRAVSVAPLLVLSTVGLVRAIWVALLLRSAARRGSASPLRPRRRRQWR